MKKKPLHFLIFFAIGSIIAIVSYVSFGAHIRPHTRENSFMNSWFFLFPLILISIMIRSYKAEKPLPYRDKLIASVSLLFIICALVVALNVFNVLGRNISLSAIVTGLKNISKFCAVQMIPAALLALIPSRTSGKVSV